MESDLKEDNGDLTTIFYWHTAHSDFPHAQSHPAALLPPPPTKLPSFGRA